MASRSNLLIRWRYRVEHALYLLGRALYNTLPAGFLRRLGPRLGGLGFHLNRRHRRVALENIQRAYPELGAQETIDLGRRCFENFGMLLTDFLCSASWDRDRYAQRFEVEGWHHLEAAEAHGKGLLFLTGHLGNWEALAQYLALNGRPVSFVARPMDNPYMETDFRQLRERFGNSSIPKRKAARSAIRILRDRGRVGILMDQRVHPNEGKAYPFFGRPAYTTSLPARLSLKTGAPAILLFGIPSADWLRCRIVIHPPILPAVSAGRSEQVVDLLTQRYLSIIEETIRQHPEQWLWMHRKWRQFYDRPPVQTAVPVRAEEPEAVPESAATRALSRGSRRA